MHVAYQNMRYVVTAFAFYTFPKAEIGSAFSRRQKPFGELLMTQSVGVWLVSGPFLILVPFIVVWFSPEMLLKEGYLEPKREKLS